ncbi:MAG: peptide chain release factor N(5)-glutamine methyltransferase [Bacteroidales bacterium]|jgi:release factor glutamine methyltransferase|nr:peptide chain release factor N(5)-glutamine methyltransferase [Bacteroidales bacterium]
MSVELGGMYARRELRAMFFIIIKATLPGYRLYMLYDMNTSVPEPAVSAILEIVGELKRGRPVQYIIGETEFYNCRITLSPATLIPRPETEELANIIVRENTGYNGQIVDVGTGSGCIAIAMAKNLPGASVFGTDFSAGAIDVAKYNAEINNVEVEFIHEDIFIPSAILSLRPGIIISNPPYIRDSEKASMHRNVLDYEPASALFVNDSAPLVFYDAILEIAAAIQQPEGKIYFEINEAMGNEMESLLRKYDYAGIRLIKDINGKDRFVKGTKNGRKTSS